MALEDLFRFLQHTHLYAIHLSNLSFELFLHILERFVFEECERHNIAKYWAGIHAAPQKFWIKSGLRLFKMEELQQAYRYIVEKLGLPPSELTLKKNSSIHKPWQSYYDEETSALVQKIYKDDFKLTGYSVDSWKDPEDKSI